MRTVLVPLMFLAVALAGCADGDGDVTVTSAECLEQDRVLGENADGEPVCVVPAFVIEEFEDPDHYCVVNRDRERLHAPDLVGNPWVIGQWWDYELELDGENQGTTRLIYYADQDVGADLPLHYMVGTPTRDQALVQAIDSINPVIGRVHSVLYSPHESGDHANMFNFPLCTGSSWQTVFYGETFTLTATRTYPSDEGDLVVDEDYRPIHDDESGNLQRYAIEGNSPEGSTLRIEYDSNAQWFTLIDLDRTSGETVTMRLESKGTGQTGEAYFLRGQRDFHGALSAEPTAPGVTVAQETLPFSRDDGGDGPYDTIGIHWVAELQGTGRATLAVVAPNGTIVHAEDHELRETPIHVDAYFEVEYAAGEWNLELDVIGGATDQDIRGTLEASIVSIYDRSCTVGGDCLA